MFRINEEIIYLDETKKKSSREMVLPSPGEIGCILSLDWLKEVVS